jgi:dual specificity phosphatase 3
MNWNFVTSRLATGSGIVTDDDVSILWKAGITAIIDCRAEQDDSAIIAANEHAKDLLYLWNGTDDPFPPDHGEPKIQWIVRSLKFAMPLFSTPNQKVYTHCQMGINRGPSTAYAIMRAFGLGDETSKAIIRISRPQTIIGIFYASDADEAVKRGW